MKPRESLEKYKRGIIWDYLVDQTGLSDYDLMQSFDVIHNNIVKYRGDNQYLLFKIRSRRIIENLKKYPKEFISETEEIKKKIGIRSTTCDFDTYFGLIRLYAWYRKPSSGGFSYSNIFYMINKLKNLYPSKKQELNSVIRRLCYIHLLGDEIKYLIDRFDHNIKPIYTEFLLNRFENFTSISAQTVLQIVELYYEMNPKLKKLKKNQCTFHKIFNLLKDEIDFFDSANDSFYSLILIELRNNIVHGCGIELEKQNNDFFLNYEIDLAIQNKLKNYKLDIRVEKVIAPLYKGTRIAENWYFIYDPNFDFVIWKLYNTKKNSFNLSNPKIIVQINMKEYIRLMVNIFLYHISDKIFRKLYKTNYSYWEGSEYFGKWINNNP